MLILNYKNKVNCFNLLLGDNIMNKIFSNSFLNYLSEHIKNTKSNAEKIAKMGIFDVKTLQNTFHLSKNQTIGLIHQLSEFGIINLVIIKNNLMIEVKDAKYFADYICVKRQYETQVMYLNLCGKVTPTSLQEVFNY